MSKIKIKKDFRSHCLRCGSLDVDVLYDGWIVCKNTQCLALTKFDYETNTQETKFTVKENSFKTRKGELIQ